MKAEVHATRVSISSQAHVSKVLLEAHYNDFHGMELPRHLPVSTVEKRDE